MLKPIDEAICDECAHDVVCGKLVSTGGVKRCEHFLQKVTETTNNDKSLFDKVSNIIWGDKQ